MYEKCLFGIIHFNVLPWFFIKHIELMVIMIQVKKLFQLNVNLDVLVSLYFFLHNLPLINNDERFVLIASDFTSTDLTIQSNNILLSCYIMFVLFPKLPF